jgi:4a-hydroxytetrahydrobiopterin dehydratase
VGDVLNQGQVEAALTALPGWEGDSKALHRSIEFASFPAAIAAVVAVAEAAESANHHPDIDIRWRTVTFTLSTHSAGGVTPLDLSLARSINEITA